MAPYIRTAHRELRDPMVQESVPEGDSGVLWSRSRTTQRTQDSRRRRVSALQAPGRGLVRSPELGGQREPVKAGS